MRKSNPVSHSNCKKTTVIIPTFNRAVMLEECLDAVSQQTLQPLEVIVVDDGGSDNTKNIVMAADVSVILMQQNNSGKSAALNAALQVVQGDYVWIIDDDDIVLPNTLETLTNLLELAPDAGFAYGRHDRFSQAVSGKRKLLGTGYWQKCTPENFLQATLQDFFAHQPGILVRREAFDRVGPFDETLTRSQDYDMMLRLARQSIPAITEKVVFWQRQHSGRRGPKAEQFDSGESNARWVAGDKAIFQKIRETWPLELFVPSRAASTSAQHRTALISRGVIMARRKLWREAIEDLEAALAITKQQLTPEEIATLRQIFQGKYGIAELFEDRSLLPMLNEFSAKAEHRSAARAMARGLVWRIRDAFDIGRTRDFVGLVRLWLALTRRPD